MINVRLTVALPGSAQLYAMQCERADNDRAAGWVMSEGREAQVVFPRYPTYARPGWGGWLVISGMPGRDFRLICVKLPGTIVYHCFCGHN